MVALGEKYAGLFTESDDIAKRLQKAATVHFTIVQSTSEIHIALHQASHDKLWRMPMVSEYASNLKSSIADLKNVGSKYGSSIQAALFLKVRSCFQDEWKLQ
jgi:leucyl aminopeptidase